MLCGVGACRHLTLAISASHRSLCFRPLYTLLKPRWPNQTRPINPIREVDSLVSLNQGRNITAGKAVQPFPELLAAVHKLFHGARIKPRALKVVRSSALLSEHLRDPEKARKLAEAMVQTASPPRARQLLAIAHRHGCRLKQNAYECVAFRLAEIGRWHLIPPIVCTGIKHTGRTTTRLLNWRARALVELNHFSHLENFQDEFRRWNLKPNRTTFHLVTSGHIRNRDLVKAKACLRSMGEHGFPVTSSTHALVASAYRSLGPDTQVRARAFEAARNADSTTATMILNGLMQLRIEAGDVPGFLQVLSLFDHLPHVVAIMSPYPGGGSTPDGGETPNHGTAIGISRPEQILRSIPFDTATFSILIDYLVFLNDLPRALTVYQNMVAVGVPPDAGTVAALVRLFFAMGHQATAVHIVARACGRDGELFHYLSPLIPMPVENPDVPLPRTGCMPLSIGILNALMRGLLDMHGMEGAHALLQMMHVSNIKPDAKTIELLVSHLHRKARTNPVRLLTLFTSILPGHVLPTLRHAHIMLGSILRREKRLRHGSGWKAAGAKFLAGTSDMSCQLPSRPNIARSFDPIAGIDIPDKAWYRSLINPIIQSLATRHVRSDRATFALRIRHEAVNRTDLDVARNVFQTMLARGMHPNEYHFSALMEGYTIQGNLLAAETVLRSAERSGIKPNVVMYTILIVGHARQGNPESAMNTFRLMLATGIQPDVPSIDAVTSAFFIVGAHTMAKRVLYILWPFVQPFPKRLRSAPLKRLAQEFRALHRDKQHCWMVISPDEQRAMHRRLECLFETWRRGYMQGVRGRRGTSATVTHRICQVHRTPTRLEAFGLR